MEMEVQARGVYHCPTCNATHMVTPAHPFVHARVCDGAERLRTGQVQMRVKRLGGHGQVWAWDWSRPPERASTPRD